jgi:hypothetical protein
MGRSEKPIVRVRLRHSWVTFLRYPLTEEQAAQLAGGHKTPLRTNPLRIQIGPPVCERCEQEYRGSAYSCPGESSA